MEGPIEKEKYKGVKLNVVGVKNSSIHGRATAGTAKWKTGLKAKFNCLPFVGQNCKAL